ncbi:T9SS type A sorting domain-containing protein [Flavobacterium piscinae]|uniref:T9SS type A sorting domain-containing protein n=1 Tax=Flavobacterium piscinae TaxID=2506424 RepID=UPI00199482EA|nr:T9SS type A sorting domain-containing protein [Flavobacterium piscinae]MBC8883879.1 T9SS type A sorting domain-containing protein [Flavobacterium piscinae]
MVGNFNGAAQVTARSLNDLALSIRNNSISGLKVYPNPVVDGTLYVSTELNEEKNVQVYDLLGKEVLNITTSNEAINISSLNTGLYVVKITEGGKSATVKLSVK